MGRRDWTTAAWILPLCQSLRTPRNREYFSLHDSVRWELLLPKSCPLARNAVVEKEDPLDIPLILHRRVGLQQEIAHWAQIEIERLHVAATYNALVGDPSAVVQSGLGYLLITDNATPSLPKPPMSFSKPSSPFANQTECPPAPLCKGSRPPLRPEGVSLAPAVQ